MDRAKDLGKRWSHGQGLDDPNSMEAQQWPNHGDAEWGESQERLEDFLQPRGKQAWNHKLSVTEKSDFFLQMKFCCPSSPFKLQGAPKRALNEYELKPQPTGSRILIISLQQREPEMPIDLREGVQHPQESGMPSGIIGHCQGQNR